jgi:hypothetical protein
MRTQRKLDRNTLGTTKNPKIPTLPYLPQMEIVGPLWCKLTHLIGFQQFLCSLSFRVLVLLYLCSFIIFGLVWWQGHNGGDIASIKPSHFFPQDSQLYSQYVPKFQCVPQSIPNRTTLYPISFSQNSTLVNFIAKPKERLYNFLFWESS